MIQKLLVVQSHDEYQVIEPITKQLLITSVVKEFACDWALGFIESINFIATGKRIDNIQCDHSVAFLLGVMAANDAWETTNISKTEINII